MQTNSSVMSSMQPARAGAAPAGNAMISSDFQTFLKMLTVQMQNQNPLEPIEASDFAAQLATFSGVEQQVLTNDLLSQMASRMGLSELASWVGKEALTSGPVYISGDPVRLVPPEVDDADRAELIVTNLDGLIVGRFPVDPYATEIIFEVPDADESGFEHGYYQVSMESFRGASSLGENPVLGYARIDEARMDAGQVLLVLQGGHMIDSSKVIGLRG